MSRRRLADVTVGGLAWTFAGAGGRAALQVIVLAVLARLLTPADFGIVTAALVVVNFSSIFSQLGVAPALVQRGSLSAAQISAATVSSLVLGVAFTAGLLAFAPPMARFFDMPSLEPILRLLSLVFVVRALSAVSEALLQRDLDFRRIARADLISYAVGYGLIGIVAASTGLGAWALALANLGQASVKGAMLVSARPPSWRAAFGWRDARALYRFGGGFTLARVGNYLALQGDNLVVARTLGAGALGIYSRAYQLMGMPANLVGQAVDRVLFPSLATVRRDGRSTERPYLRGVAILGMATLPAGAALVVLGPELVTLVLGEAWLAAVAPLQFFAACLLFRVGDRFNAALLRAAGVVYRRGLLQLAYAALVLTAAWIGHPWGPAGVAAGVSVAMFANYAASSMLAIRVAGTSITQFVARLVRGSILGGWVALASTAVARILRGHEVGSGITVLAVVIVVVGGPALLALSRPGWVIGADGVWLAGRLRARLGAQRSGDSDAGRDTAPDGGPP